MRGEAELRGEGRDCLEPVRRRVNPTTPPRQAVDDSTISRVSPQTKRSVERDAFFDQAFAHGDGGGVVDLEDLDRGARTGSPAAEPCAFPCEVSGPFVAPRVEEGHDGAAHGVHAGDVRPLGGIAEETGERKVRGVAPAAVLPGDDVIDLEGQRGVRLGEVAILATRRRTPPHAGGRGGRSRR